MPYVFQILSLLLEEQTGAVPENYLMILSHLLSPDLWSQNANVPALVRLLRAILEKGAKEVDGQKLVSGTWRWLARAEPCVVGVAGTRADAAWA